MNFSSFMSVAILLEVVKHYCLASHASRLGKQHFIQEFGNHYWESISTVKQCYNTLLLQSFHLFVGAEMIFNKVVIHGND